MSEVTLYHGDCLDILPTLADGSVDAVVTDPPYGTTACKWDSVIPFVPMWEQLWRVGEDRAAVVLFASEPFASALIMSNVDDFRYCWYWKKERGTGFITSDRRPLMIIESACVFYMAQPIYHPEREPLDNPYRHVLPVKKGQYQGEQILNGSLVDGERKYREYTHKTPTQLLEFSRKTRSVEHPTQKPVELMRYLIETYTDEGDTVLDFTMGSGTTGVACVQTGRNFIGIEIDEGYFNIAQKRIAEAQMQPSLFDMGEK